MCTEKEEEKLPRTFLTSTKIFIEDFDCGGGGVGGVLGGWGGWGWVGGREGHCLY